MEIGENCDPDDLLCDEGLKCIDNKCVECTMDEDCEHECQDNKCIEYVGIGDICNDHLICDDGECYIRFRDDRNKTCNKKVGHGEECDNMYYKGNVICERSRFDTLLYECVKNEESSLGGKCEITSDVIIIHIIVFALILLILLIIGFIIYKLLQLYGYTNNFFIKITDKIISFFVSIYHKLANISVVQGNVTDVTDVVVEGQTVLNPVGNARNIPSGIIRNRR